MWRRRPVRPLPTAPVPVLQPVGLSPTRPVPPLQLLERWRFSEQSSDGSPPARPHGPPVDRTLSEAVVDV